MSVCLDDLNSLPERYRKQVQQQMQAQQIDRTARVMARFVTEEKGKAEVAEATQRKHHNHPTARTLPNGTEHTQGAITGRTLTTICWWYQAKFPQH